jgi:hypothetical protein
VTKIELRHWCLAALGALACVVATGCGGMYDSTVSGVVTLDGTPVHRGTVSFHPVAPGPAAYARIEDDGSYEVRTGREEGLPPGDYQVTVISSEPPTISQTATGGPPPAGKPITPLWYRTKDTSGLKFTVASGHNDINLELSTTPPPGWKPRGR